MSASELLAGLINDAYRNGKHDAFRALKLMVEPVADLEERKDALIDRLADALVELNALRRR